MPTAIVKMRRRQFPPRPNLRRSLLNERPERRQPSPRAEHEDRDVTIDRQMESLMTRFHRHVHDIPLFEVREVPGSDADVAALPAEGLGVKDGVGEGCAAGVRERRGGDAVLADAHGHLGGDEGA